MWKCVVECEVVEFYVDYIVEKKLVEVGVV